jgi:hypothetical protein
MLSNAFPARTTADMLLMLIATTSSRTCTKPFVEPTPTVKAATVH